LAAVALAVSLVALAGVAVAARRWDTATVGAIAVLAGVGLVVALLGGLDATTSVIESLADDVPGGGILADGHAWLAPLALLLAVGAGALAGMLAKEAGARAGNAVVAVVGVVGVAIPIALLPSLAFALDGELDDSRFPGDWWEVKQLLEDRDPAGTLVLPFAADREFTWNDERRSADPARIYFPGNVVLEDQREIAGVIVPGRDPRATAIREAMEGSPDDFVQILADNGIDTVVIERDVSGPAAPRGTEFGERLHRGSQLVVYALPDDLTTTAVELDAPPEIALLVADSVAALLGLAAAGAWIFAGRVPRREPLT
jgi:hypothetical protein